MCDVLETSCFVSHIHAYEVTYSHTVAVFNVDHSFDYHPLGLYHSPLDNTLVVSLKYHIIEHCKCKCEIYAKKYRCEHTTSVIANWCGYHTPFLAVYIFVNTCLHL